MMADSVPHIGIDAMGGDHGPQAVVDGVVLAQRRMPGCFRVTLVGDEPEIRAALSHARAEAHLPLEVVHAAERIEMSEKAVSAARRKSGSSLGVLTQLHKDGKVDALFSAGNTGAMVATSLLGLGRIESVSRPALAAVMPNPGGGTVLLDVGANSECKPSWLVQFAHMGAVYARYLLGRKEPRVGLLSIGEEDTKGNSLVLETLPLLRRARHLNFVGNVEGRDILKGTCDVVVTDGFTGNVVLKTAEGVATMLGHKVKQELSRDLLARVGAMFLMPALRRVKAEVDWEEYGAAPLLGVNGVCFVGHGSSGPRAVCSAIRNLSRFVELRVNEHIREEIEADHDSAA
jgi:glycerol-3-phosphate acyltransferase PlsX